MFQSKHQIIFERATAVLPGAACWAIGIAACVLLGACSPPADSEGWDIGAGSDGEHDREHVCGDPDEHRGYGELMIGATPGELPEDCKVFRGEIKFWFYEGVDLSVLPELRVIEKSLEIQGSETIESLHGLEKLETVGGSCRIWGNPLLDDLSELSSLQTVGTLHLKRVRGLNDLGGLEGLESVSELYVQEIPKLTDLGGLEGLQAVGSRLIIENNDGLQSLEGIGGVTTVGEVLIIDGNDHLESLQGLQGLQVMGGSLRVSHNDSLQSLEGLVQLETIQEGLYL